MKKMLWLLFVCAPAFADLPQVRVAPEIPVEEGEVLEVSASSIVKHRTKGVGIVKKNYVKTSKLFSEDPVNLVGNSD